MSIQKCGSDGSEAAEKETQEQHVNQRVYCTLLAIDLTGFKQCTRYDFNTVYLKASRKGLCAGGANTGKMGSSVTQRTYAFKKSSAGCCLHKRITHKHAAVESSHSRETQR